MMSCATHIHVAVATRNVSYVKHGNHRCWSAVGFLIVPSHSFVMVRLSFSLSTKSVVK